MNEIYIAGGCFWGVEAYYQRLKGVIDTRVGYLNSDINNVTYAMVCEGNSGAVEACWIQYDESLIELESIIDHMFRIVDPTSLNRQGNDTGTQYRTGIYHTNKDVLEQVRTLLIPYQARYNKPLRIEIEHCKNFIDAETYHQSYLVKNPTGCCHIDFTKALDGELK